MQKSLISTLHLEFPWHDIPMNLKSARTTLSQRVWLRKCSSKVWKRTWHSAQHAAQVGFSSDRATLWKATFFRGNHRPTMFVFILLGHFQRFFLKSASKFVFFGFILDFGGWKVVHNLRKWEIQPTAMTSEVRSHKIGKRNWSEAIGIEAAKGIIDLLYQKLGVNQPVSGISPSFTCKSAIFLRIYTQFHLMSLYLDLHDTWDFNRHRCTWNAMKSFIFSRLFPQQVMGCYRFSGAESPVVLHWGFLGFLCPAPSLIHVLGNLKSPVNIRNQCRLFRLNPHQIAGWWNQFRTDCWCRFSIFISPAQNEVCMKMGHTKSSGTQILYCFYILWNIAWYPIVPPISIFSWETMGIAYVKKMETIYSRISTSFPENADRHSIFFDGKNIEHPFFCSGKDGEIARQRLGRPVAGPHLFHLATVARCGPCEGRGGPGGLGGDGNIDTGNHGQIPLKIWGESDQGATKNDLVGGLEHEFYIFP